MKNLLFSSLFFLSFLAYGQNTPDFSWLTGTWTGPGFGGTFEEVWSDPAEDGTMMGMFRHFGEDGTVSFYEFWVLDSTGMKLRHFNEDFTGWETREEYVSFEKVEFSPGKVILKGLTYEQTGPNKMVISLKLTHEGVTRTEVFNMTRNQ